MNNTNGIEPVAPVTPVAQVAPVAPATPVGPVPRASLFSPVVIVIVAALLLVLFTVVGLVILKKNVQEGVKQGSTLPVETPKTTNMPSSVGSSTMTLLKPADATDAKLDSDFTGIDASITAVDADAAAIDAGLNDTMGDLSE